MARKSAADLVVVPFQVEGATNWASTEGERRGTTALLTRRQPELSVTGGRTERRRFDYDLFQSHAARGASRAHGPLCDMPGCPLRVGHRGHTGLVLLTLSLAAKRTNSPIAEAESFSPP
jgi:hypothetical protein